MRLVLMFSLLFAAAPAFADDLLCEELWFTRNLIHDRAGHCFASPLGQALFDNSDCTSSAAVPPPADQITVAQIRETEIAAECAIDTTATTLEHRAMLEPYRALQDIPARDLYESGCIGYRGQTLALHSGASATSPVIGWIGPGANIGFAHWPRDGWDFVIITKVGPTLDQTLIGWTLMGQGPPDCDGYAG